MKLFRAFACCLVFVLGLGACLTFVNENEDDDNDRSDSRRGSSGAPGAPGAGSTVVTGSGNITSESRPVSGFDSVSIDGVGKLFLDQTGTESLVIEAEDNLLPHIISEVRGGKLFLNIARGYSISATQPLNFRLTVKALSSLEAFGSGDIEATRLQTSTLKIDQNGSLDITASGSTDDVEVSLSGSGDFEAAQLKTKKLKVDASGSGSALVQVGDSLEANLSGSGSVEYIGNPKVIQRVSGSGDVERRT